MVLLSESSPVAGTIENGLNCSLLYLMPDEPESCKNTPASHTSALGELFIADEWAGAQGGIYKVGSEARKDINKMSSAALTVLEKSKSPPGGDFVRTAPPRLKPRLFLVLLFAALKALRHPKARAPSLLDTAGSSTWALVAPRRTWGDGVDVEVCALAFRG